MTYPLEIFRRDVDDTTTVIRVNLMHSMFPVHISFGRAGVLLEDSEALALARALIDAVQAGKRAVA